MDDSATSSKPLVQREKNGRLKKGSVLNPNGHTAPHKRLIKEKFAKALNDTLATEDLQELIETLKRDHPVELLRMIGPASLKDDPVSVSVEADTVRAITINVSSEEDLNDEE